MNTISFDRQDNQTVAEISHGYVNIVPPSTHLGYLTLQKIQDHSEGFSKPALFKHMIEIDEKFSTRKFYERVDPNKTLQWRVKSADSEVGIRSKDGASDYNYVTGKVGTGSEFLDDIFVRRLDVYSHLGTISSGFDDPYEWGKDAFRLVRDEILREGWFNVPEWRITGHMFLGNSTQEFGEPRHGAVGSDWHMFPTLNIFVMIAGRKKWTTRPPMIGEQFCEYDRLFPTSSGREAAGVEFDGDTIYIEPGDVLLNPPFEWHKVLNDIGFTLGAAFRIIDVDYLSRIRSRKNLDLLKADPATHEEMAHFVTSANYASRHLNRAQMLLNDVEYLCLRKRVEANPVRIGHL